MPLTYDGSDVFRKNEDNIDDYTRFQQRDNAEVARILREEEAANRAKAAAAWKRWCPSTYADATIRSIADFDITSARTLASAVRASKSDARPRGMLITSDATSGGKTWAMYAYLSALVRNGVLTRPLDEIRITTESDLFDGLRNYSTRGSTLRWLFAAGVRLIAVDPIRGAEDKTGLVWPRIVDKAMATGVSFVFCMNIDRNKFAGDAFLSNVDKLVSDSDSINLTGWSNHG
jgi:hypothetical protein